MERSDYTGATARNGQCWNQKPEWIIRIIKWKIITAYHPAWTELIKFISQTLNHLSSKGHYSEAHNLKSHPDDCLSWMRLVWVHPEAWLTTQPQPRLHRSIFKTHLALLLRPWLHRVGGLPASIGYTGFQPRGIDRLAESAGILPWYLYMVPSSELSPPDMRKQLVGCEGMAGGGPQRERPAIIPSWGEKHVLGLGNCLGGEYCSTCS